MHYKAWSQDLEQFDKLLSFHHGGERFLKDLITAEVELLELKRSFIRRTRIMTQMKMILTYRRLNATCR